ncbi:hypothetical protein GZA27_000584 [Salmonella enterica]|nr:hypothetical protein [Salmonella enterica]EDR0765092.1 hypothetical protein [Salmonella enterica subsp. enterica serovar Thompson]EDR7370265.1 hypothetical protein [Salmonella enterica subsp. enterica serovar Enteritidis]EDS4018007.1 hypothetical protein [Salmonella enterica subsp. enterica serovar Enteritidis]EDS4206501.1 hypothetical protein [Salmonella enterica subsp. enterica serovar Enteritidis]
METFLLISSAIVCYEPVARFCCVKRSASRQNTVAFLLLLEEPDADKTTHSNSLSACF